MSEQQKRKYDSTVARIAGNILSGRKFSPDGVIRESGLGCGDVAAVEWAVGLARAIVAEVERTEPSR